ncbi:MAG: DsrE family protein [Proteobacteria bacterium]|nr:DsrE family protein [Pseudomonadota bacterium]MBU1903852.1 DsrE family protein [Pseudomonadota bacterium]
MAEKKVLVNICRAPFGTVFYTEGLRAAVGVSAGIDENIPTILFQSDGVFYCLKDVDRTDALAYFESFKSMGTQLYAVKEDLDERGVEKSELAPDITVISRDEAFTLFQENDFNMDF